MAFWREIAVIGSGDISKTSYRPDSGRLTRVRRWGAAYRSKAVV
jgi:hypothetical protein